MVQSHFLISNLEYLKTFSTLFPRKASSQAAKCSLPGLQLSCFPVNQKQVFLLDTPVELPYTHRPHFQCWTGFVSNFHHPDLLHDLWLCALSAQTATLKWIKEHTAHSACTFKQQLL